MIGSTAALFTVFMPAMVSTRNCWLAAPRLNFSLTSAVRGPHGKADQHVERNPGEHDQGHATTIGEQNTDEHEGEDKVDRREQGIR